MSSLHIPAIGGEVKTQKRWALSVPSFFVFWIMGLGFLWWLVVPVILFAFRPRGERSVSGAAWLLMAIGAILALSLVAGVASGATDAGRAPGAAYGALIWVCAGMLYSVLQSASARELYKFVSGLVIVSAVQGALTTIAVFLHPSVISQFPLPTAGILANAGGVAPWTKANLAFNSWFGESVVRSNGLQATAAWAGGLACLVLIMLILHRRSLLDQGMNPLWWLLASLLTASSLYFSYTRVSYAILIAVIVYYFLTRTLSRALPGGSLIAAMIFFLLVVCGYLYAPWSEFLLEQDALRPGSSDARFSSYFEGATTAIDGGPFVLTIGSGAKPFLEELGRGAGSESTYVSLLVRGGLVCLAMFIFFIWLRIRLLASKKDWVSLALICALAIHAIVEDLDVGTFTIVFAMLNLSTLDNADSINLHQGSETDSSRTRVATLGL